MIHLDPYYLEINPSGVGHGTGLLQVQDDVNCGQDEVTDIATLHLIGFASKSLLRIKQD